MRRRGTIAIAAVLVATAGVAIAQSSSQEGRIGPENRIQPSGRLLNPVGIQTKLGNLPAGGALTYNGRFMWTLSAGRGQNDIRIVQVAQIGRCPAGRRGAGCRRRRAARVGRVVQVIPMPGLTGGIVMAPDGRTAYVSGSPESPTSKVAEDVPGREGDVIHILRYDGTTGRAERAGVIPVPPPSDAPTVQEFPPSNRRMSWPRDLAISGDGKTLLAALNLADRAAVIDTESKRVRLVPVGRYPYGAGITRDGRGLISNEADGTVSVIDLDDARVIKTIQVGPHLSHPEGIAVDTRARRAYVAVTEQDIIAVIDTASLEVERTLSVARSEPDLAGCGPAGNQRCIGAAPVALNVTDNGRRLLVANSGDDTVAIFELPRPPKRLPPGRLGEVRSRTGRPSAADRAERILQHEGRKGVELSESAEEEAAEVAGEESEERAEEAKERRPARKLAQPYELIGRIPVGSYPVAVASTPGVRKLVWVSAKGLGVGPNADPSAPRDEGSATGASSNAHYFRYLPEQVFGSSGILNFPSEAEIRRLTPRAARQLRPVNNQPPPPGTPIAPPQPGGENKIEHVFYIVRENRTYDQILGADPRGDGDPKLELFGESITPNAHALARRFPLLDHVYANSEASIDGHFWTSAADVSDYVIKNWHANYADRKRPYDFGVYAVTWPSQRFLFDQAERQGISYFNYGEAIAGVVPLPDRDRRREEEEQVARKLANSDLGPPQGCFPNDASSGGRDEVLNAATGRVREVEVFDSSLPPGAPPGSESRFDCFRARFLSQVAQNRVPAFNYITLPNDHTGGTRAGRRTPQAMIAENDLALGQTVELISNSPIWRKSLILVIEDDSQDGADHVDAHRIPAFVISPYAKRGAVIHTRYDFLSFIRTLEIPIGMKPLNLFDATATPLYDAFDPEPNNAEPYEAITPQQDLLERNAKDAPNAKLSAQLPLDQTDRTPQRILDRILWQAVHGPDSEPPPPGPNASGIDEAEWLRRGLPGLEREEAGEGEEEE